MSRVVIFVIIFAVFLLGAKLAWAALPTLDDFLALIPQPVIGFFNTLEDFDFGANSDEISENLPGAGKPISRFLDAIWSIIMILLKGVGSVFVWVFRGFANFLESLIFSS